MHEKSPFPVRLRRMLHLEPGAPEEPLAQAAWQEAQILAAPRSHGLRLLRADFDRLFTEHLAVSDHARRTLAGCHAVWAVAASIGQSLEERAGGLFRAGEAYSGYVMDLCGSLLADKALRARMDDVKRRELAALGLAEGKGVFTRRLSPGYKDFPLAAQQPLTALVGAGAGLACLPSMALHPQKSVTALIGVLSPEARP